MSDQPPTPPRPDRTLGVASFPAPPTLPVVTRTRSRPAGQRILAAVVLAALLVAGALGSLSAIAPPSRSGEQQRLSYIFLHLANGKPIRWNPCRPIHYVVNADLGPADSIDLVRAATQRVTDATGITFVYDGPTNELPSGTRPIFQPQRYGQEWAPVLIAWVHPSASRLSFGPADHQALGVALPLLQFAGDRPYQYVSGEIAMNADDSLPDSFGIPGSAGLVLQHELGHIVGLGHANVYGELMGTTGGGMLDWGPGDLAGLRQLGRSAGCFSTPEPP
jgi:hypothetical protein